MTSESPPINYQGYKFALKQALDILRNSDDPEISAALELSSSPWHIETMARYSFYLTNQRNPKPDEPLISLDEFIRQHPDYPPDYLEALRLIDKHLLQILKNNFGITKENCPFI